MQKIIWRHFAADPSTLFLHEAIPLQFRNIKCHHCHISYLHHSPYLLTCCRDWYWFMGTNAKAVISAEGRIFMIHPGLYSLSGRKVSPANHLSCLFSMKPEKLNEISVKGRTNTGKKKNQQNNCDVTNTASPLNKRTKTALKGLLAWHTCLLNGNKWQAFVRERKKKVSWR